MDTVNVNGRSVPLSAEVIAQLLAFGAATLHEASGKVGALPSVIQCQTPGMHVAGRAVPVHGPPGDNLWLHRAVYECQPGDVIVATFNDAYEAGYWGELLSWAGQIRQLAGVVIDGCIRDVGRLGAIGLPVFARGTCIRATTKHAHGLGSINEPICIGDVTVHAGDYMVGDADGVVVIAGARLDDVIRLAGERDRYEFNVIAALRNGATTLETLGLPARSELPL
jgi:4-hydroxy-4-methyl-2-oxoglutarate aldolase